MNQKLVVWEQLFPMGNGFLYARTTCGRLPVVEFAPGRARTIQCKDDALRVYAALKAILEARRAGTYLSFAREREVEQLITIEGPRLPLMVPWGAITSSDLQIDIEDCQRRVNDAIRWVSQTY